MTFRVIPGNPTQPDVPAAQPAARAQPRSVTLRPGPAAPARAADDSGRLMPLVERLESLAVSLEGMGVGGRSYAAEAVMETLARMERRDLQSLAAVEAFAGALKTVGQHLASLRHVVHGFAQDQHSALDLIGDRLAVLEGRLGVAALPASGDGLEAILDRLGQIETLVATPAPGLDADPVVRLLETVAHRVLAVEDKVDALPAQIQIPAVDLSPLSGTLESIAQQMGRVEEHVVHAQAGGAARVLAAVEEIARRVGHIEQKIDQSPGHQPPEPFDSTPILDTLQDVARRVANMEGQAAQSAPDLEQLSGFLERITQRLDRMEAGFSRAAPMAAGIDDSERPAAAAPMPPRMSVPSQPQSPPQAAAVAPAPKPMPARVPPVSAEDDGLPKTISALAPETEAEPADSAQARQRVDMLLEQVFRVLSR